MILGPLAVFIVGSRTGVPGLEVSHENTEALSGKVTVAEPLVELVAVESLVSVALVVF
jgi:hypothetical protein